MKKITKKSHLILYGCAGLGVNMLNLIVGSYLCSALLIGGFGEEDIGFWTYSDKDLVVAALWGSLVFFAKVIDGIIDLPLSSFTDRLRTKWGRRRPSIILGFIPMIIAYLLFLVPINNSATVLNTLWFALLLFVFYGCYTLTMLTYYATFAEIVENKNDIVLISNTKSICDIVYFCLGFALIPLFVSFGTNIRYVALIFLPMALTMLIPLFMLKENPTNTEGKLDKTEHVTLIGSITYAFKCKEFIIWMTTASVMNIGLQLFLGGINEYFSVADLNMTLVMASCFVPVPFTIFLYNRVVKKKGLGFAFRYILLVFSIGMGLMFFCSGLSEALMLPYAIGCGIIVSFSIGSFFSVTYIVPSHIAASRQKEDRAASSMFFAVQGLFEGIATGFATGILLVYLKENGYIQYMTTIVAVICMLAFAMTYLLPKSITMIGKEK